MASAPKRARPNEPATPTGEPIEWQKQTETLGKVPVYIIDSSSEDEEDSDNVEVLPGVTRAQAREMVLRGPAVPLEDTAGGDDGAGSDVDTDEPPAVPPVAAVVVESVLPDYYSEFDPNMDVDLGVGEFPDIGMGADDFEPVVPEDEPVWISPPALTISGPAPTLPSRIETAAAEDDESVVVTVSPEQLPDARFNPDTYLRVIGTAVVTGVILEAIDFIRRVSGGDPTNKMHVPIPRFIQDASRSVPAKYLKATYTVRSPAPIYRIAGEPATHRTVAGLTLSDLGALVSPTTNARELQWAYQMPTADGQAYSVYLVPYEMPLPEAVSVSNALERAGFQPDIVTTGKVTGDVERLIKRTRKLARGIPPNFKDVPLLNAREPPVVRAVMAFAYDCIRRLRNPELGILRVTPDHQLVIDVCRMLIGRLPGEMAHHIHSADPSVTGLLAEKKEKGRARIPSQRALDFFREEVLPFEQQLDESLMPDIFGKALAIWRDLADDTLWRPPDDDDAVDRTYYEVYKTPFKASMDRTHAEAKRRLGMVVKTLTAPPPTPISTPAVPPAPAPRLNIVPEPDAIPSPGVRTDPTKKRLVPTLVTPLTPTTPGLPTPVAPTTGPPGERRRITPTPIVQQPVILPRDRDEEDEMEEDAPVPSRPTGFGLPGAAPKGDAIPIASAPEPASVLREIRIVSEHIKSARVIRAADEMELLALADSYREAVLEAEITNPQPRFDAKGVEGVLEKTQENLGANAPNRPPINKWENILGTALVTGRLDIALDYITGKTEMEIRTPVFIGLSAENEPSKWIYDTSHQSSGAVRDMEVEYLRARREYLRKPRRVLLEDDDSEDDLMEVDGSPAAARPATTDPTRGLFVPSYIKKALARRDETGAPGKLAQPKQSDPNRITAADANSTYLKSYDEIIAAAVSGDQEAATAAVHQYIGALSVNELSTNPTYSEMDPVVAKEAIVFKKSRKDGGAGGDPEQILFRRRRRFALTRLHSADRRPVKPEARINGAYITTYFSPAPAVTDEEYADDQQNDDDSDDGRRTTGDLIRPLTYMSLREASGVYDEVYDLMVRHPDEVYVPHSKSENLATLLRLERESRAYRYGLYEYAQLVDIGAGPLATSERAIVDAWAEELISALDSKTTRIYSERVKARNAVLADPTKEVPGAAWNAPDVLKDLVTLELLPTPPEAPTPWKNAPLIARWPGMSQEEWMQRPDAPYARLSQAEAIFNWAVGELRKYVHDSSGVGTKGRVDPLHFVPPELRTLLELSEILIQRIPGGLAPVDDDDEDDDMAPTQDEEEPVPVPVPAAKTKTTGGGGEDDGEDLSDSEDDADEGPEVGGNTFIPQTNNSLFGYSPDVGISPLYMGLRLFEWYASSSDAPPQRPKETDEAYAKRLADAKEAYKLLSLRRVREFAGAYFARPDKDKPEFLRMVTEDHPAINRVQTLYTRAYPDLVIDMYDEDTGDGTIGREQDDEEEPEDGGSGGGRAKRAHDRTLLAHNTASLPKMNEFMLRQVLETNHAARAINYRTIIRISNEGPKASEKRVRKLFTYIATWLRTYTSAILKDDDKALRAEFRKLSVVTPAPTPLLDQRLAELRKDPDTAIGTDYNLIAAMFAFDAVLRYSTTIMTKQASRSSLRFKMRSGVLAWRAQSTPAEELLILDTETSEASRPKYTKMRNYLAPEAAGDTVHHLLGLGLMAKHVSARIQVENDAGDGWMRNVSMWLAIPHKSLRLGRSYIPFDLTIEDTDLRDNAHTGRVSSIVMAGASRLESPIRLSAMPDTATRTAAKADDPAQRMTPAVIASSIANAILQHVPPPPALENHIRTILEIPDTEPIAYDEPTEPTGLVKIKSLEQPTDDERATDDGDDDDEEAEALPDVGQLFGGGGEKTTKDRPQ